MNYCGLTSEHGIIKSLSKAASQFTIFRCDTLIVTKDQAGFITGITGI